MAGDDVVAMAAASVRSSNVSRRAFSMSSAKPQHEHTAAHRGHEPANPNLKAISIAVLVIISMIVAVHLGSIVLGKILMQQREPVESRQTYSKTASWVGPSSL